MTAEFEQLRRDAQQHRPTLLDTYGAESEAEFFAVTTECFFDCPVELRAEHPRLYEILVGYYRQDPAARIEPLKAHRQRRPAISSSRARGSSDRRFRAAPSSPPPATSLVAQP